MLPAEFGELNDRIWAACAVFVIVHRLLTLWTSLSLMKFRDLLDAWQQTPKPARTRERYRIRLTVDDAARLKALVDLHPGTDEEQIITDLLSTAIDEVEAALPYVAGDTVISEDDHGDPIYEDAGLTPRFLELARKYNRTLRDE